MAVCELGALTGQCQHGRLGLIQAVHARRPIATTVFKVSAEDVLEKGRRQFIMLFIGLVQSESRSGFAACDR